MLHHTRAMIAAATFTFITGKKVAGLYDHAAACDRRIAAEARGDALQAFDGHRGAKFGGTLPELYDAGDKAYVSLEIDGEKVRGYDRHTASFYAAHVADGAVQVFDHAEGAWFTYDVQDADAAQSYYRDVEASG